MATPRAAFATTDERAQRLDELRAQFATLPLPMEHVRDTDGHIVRMVRVTPGERTCLGCGEVVSAAEPFCVVCVNGHDTVAIQQANANDLIATESYLHPDEYALVR